MRGSRSKKELMLMHPKGCAPPASDLYVCDWAEAQLAHGLDQRMCKCHGLWLFPQERLRHAGPFITHDEFLIELGQRLRDEDSGPHHV